MNAREGKHKDLGARESHVDEAVEWSRRGEIDARALAGRRTAFMAGSPRIAEKDVSLDNGSTHALDLPFPVHLHWLPVHASWLDQIEIVFSALQREALTPNDFDSTHHVRQRIRAFFAERNRRAQPIQWT